MLHEAARFDADLARRRAARFTFRTLAAGLVALVAFMGGAAAAAAAPKLRMDHVKHLAWDLRQDYIDASEYGYADEESTRCRRMKRAVIDCRTRLLVWTEDEEVCVEDGTSPETAECPAGSHQEIVSYGLVTKWRMRYRARRWEGGYIADYYFPADRYASTDPTDARFGGLALRQYEIETS